MQQPGAVVVGCVRSPEGALGVMFYKELSAQWVRTRTLTTHGAFEARGHRSKLVASDLPIPRVLSHPSSPNLSFAHMFSPSKRSRFRRSQASALI